MLTENDESKLAGRLRKLLNDESIPHEEKVRRLEDMRLDLIERLRATEESMEKKANDDPGRIGDELQEVTEALTQLQGSTAE